MSYDLLLHILAPIPQLLSLLVYAYNKTTETKDEQKMQKTKMPNLQQLATLKSTSSLALILKISTIAIALSALYFQDLSIIFNDALENQATSHVLAIPILFIYLVYRKRKMLRASIPLKTTNQLKETKYLATISGLLLSTAAVMLYWYGSYTFTPLEYHILTLPIFAAGLMLILFNPQTLRQLAFPIIFLTFLTPPPSEILYGLGSTLSVISSEASHTIVSALGVPSTISSQYGNPTIIITRPDQTTVGFTVDIACSGIYSLIGFLIFAAFIAYIIRDKTWKKAATLLLGLPLIYLLNITRITTILLIGYQYGEQLALQVFHLIGGWILIFLGTLLLLTASEKLFKTQMFTKTQPPTACPKCNPAPSNPSESFCTNCGRLLKYPKIDLHKSDIAKIAAVAIVTMLLFSIQAPVFALTQGPAQILIQTPEGEQGNTQILPQVQNYSLQFIYRDQEFEQEAKQDAALIYAYIKTNEPIIWVGIEIAPTKSSLHPWEVCLISWPQTHGYQPSVTQLDLRDVQILQNPPIIARYFAFQYTESNQTQLVLYWFETTVFTMNNTSQQKQVKISLITYPNSPQDVPTSEEQLLPFATAIANYWEPIKTWTLIALIISQNGLALTATTTVSLAAILIYSTFEKANSKKANRSAYEKLSTPHQQLIDAVAQTQKNTTPTTANIAKTYKNITETEISPEDLAKKLEEAENIGLISHQIMSRQDQPLQVWKAKLS